MVGDLRDCEVIGPQMFGEYWLAQLFQAPIEFGHRKALVTQRCILAGGELQRMTETALSEPAQHRVALGQECEVADIMTAFA